MIQEAIAETQRKIQNACQKAGRDCSEVTLVAVSKTKPLDMIQIAYDAGLREFGENKPQELRDKAAAMSEPVHWHMIGFLQKNKIKYVVGTACLIHSVDSLELAEAIQKEAEKKQLVCDVLLEINIAKEESKHGFYKEELFTALPLLSALKNLHIRGLMTVAPYTEHPEENRCYFREMRELLIDINHKNIDNIFMDVLSMGMTADYEIAIEEGATIVRVGTGIFGERDYSQKA